MKPSEQTALVLSGGGVYGAFEIGVMKTLFAGASPVNGYKPLEVGIFSGTSVGAFNAACMTGFSQQNELDAALRLESIWLERIADRPGVCGTGSFRIRGTPGEFIDPNCLRQPVALATRMARDSLVLGRYLLGRGVNFLVSPAPPMDRVTSTVNIESFVDPLPFQNLVNNAFREEDVLNSTKRLALVATNWSMGVPEYFKNSDFVNGHGYEIVRASAALPGVFPPVKINNDTYVDGGVTENTPLNSALSAGATELHVVYLNPKPQFLPLKGQPDTLDTMLRVFYLLLAGRIEQDVVNLSQINQGLQALAKFQNGGNVPTNAALAFAKIAAKALQNSHQLVTVHRYYPRGVLAGEFGMLDSQLQTIVNVIEAGENIALTHDCQESGCLLPE
jgi:NTE family protein